jgi:hypothetical protein
MSTKLVPGPFNCYESAAKDEPIFTLRANDGNAPEVIEFWAELYFTNKVNANKFDDRARRKHREALQCAEEMRVWKATHTEHDEFSTYEHQEAARVMDGLMAAIDAEASGNTKQAPCDSPDCVECEIDG